MDHAGGHGDADEDEDMLLMTQQYSCDAWDLRGPEIRPQHGTGAGTEATEPHCSPAEGEGRGSCGEGSLPGTQGDHVFRVCLTGGPCAGKTTAIGMLRERLERLGYSVVLAPETATLMFKSIGGMPPAWLQDGSKLAQMQAIFIRQQMSTEDNLISLLKMRGGRMVLICDRGCLDGHMFLTPPQWEECIDQVGLAEEWLRDTRYDMVVHMVSAAIGAPAFYEWGPGSANPERFHNCEQAAESCRAGQKVYQGHPHLHIVDNSTSFERKVERVLALVLRGMKEPPPGVKKRALVAPIADADLRRHVDFRAVDSCVRWLQPLPGGLRRLVRRRGQEGPGGACTFQLCTEVGRRECGKEGGYEGMRERQISAQDYSWYVSAQGDTEHKRNEVLKRTRCFVFQGRYWELNDYHRGGPDRESQTEGEGEPLAEEGGALTLDIECETASEDVHIPPFLTQIHARSSGGTFASPRPRSLSSIGPPAASQGGSNGAQCSGEPIATQMNGEKRSAELDPTMETKRQKP